MQLIERLRRCLEFRARRKIAAYERRHKKARPWSERPAPIDVEATFDEFVRDFGGYKISGLIEEKSAMPQNADYLFREQNVVAELKTLSGIFAGPDAPKQLVKAYVDAGSTRSELMGLLWRAEPIPEPVKLLVEKRIRRSLEKRIRKARKQLRHSKLLFGNDGTKALIIFAMDQVPLFGHSAMLANIAKVMADNSSDPDTDDDLNPNTPTQMQQPGMEFAGWHPFYRDDVVNKELSQFVNLLGNRWLTFYAQKIGETNPILELKSPEEMMALLRRR